MRQYKPEGSGWACFKGFRTSEIEEMLADGSIVEAPAIKCSEDHTLQFNLGLNMYGELPIGEFEYRVDGKETNKYAVMHRISKNTCFKVVGIEKDTSGKTRVNLSRKEAQKECYDAYITKLVPGQVIDASITHIEDYGAFCDIGCGIVALLPVKDFCAVKIKDPKEALKFYKNIKVVVKEIDEFGRVLLSHKELLGTWQEEASKFNIGDTVAGVVRAIEEYGAFIELTPNLTGLTEPVDGLKVGDNVLVSIKGIIPEKMKIKLIINSTDNVDRSYPRLDYRLPKNGRLDTWKYSPENCSKLIETKF